MTRSYATLAAGLALATIGPAASAGLIFSEVMYNPASGEDDWEWVEVYNGGTTTVNLAGYVFDDNNSLDHAAANIASGSIAPGGTGILFNVDDVSPADFEAAWGTGANLIPVTNWSANGLNNSGDTIGLWDSFASYSGDNVTHANAVANLTFDDSGPWPSDDGSSSIFLIDVSFDPTDGGNWALSATNVEGAVTSTSAAGNSGADVGSPGIVPTPDLVLTGVIDGPITGGLPKAIELYAKKDIGDLGLYGLESANNGGPSGGPEFTFPSGDMVAAGGFLYVATESTEFSNFFGLGPDYTGAVASINGDDVILLFKNGVVVDVFGVVGVDGTGEPWEYMDGWAYRRSGTGPDGDMFVLSNWVFSGPNALDGETTNASAQTPFPIGTYRELPEPATLALLGLGLAGLGVVRRRSSRRPT